MLKIIFIISIFKIVSASASSCGIMSQSSSLIVNGEFSWQNEFPWMTIISRKDNGTWSHHGSGSLISAKHIIAHALAVSYVDLSSQLLPISPKRVKIYLGSVKYGDMREQGSLHMTVSNITIHPNATKVSNSLSVNKFAIIKLSNAVNFTEFIRPVCLWTFSHNMEEIIGRDAYIVGYGVNFKGRETLTRKYARMTVTNSSACEQIYSNELKFENSTSSRFFCAIGKNNEGPCKKDNQLFFKVGNSWHLRGILSTVVYLENGSCHVKKPVLFEDIVGSVKWIESVVKDEENVDV
ncbi:hypothetical protein PVAND_001473 [Polypedilum vanderplanki]|uniref:Peptidase S1 domain-containing protein n=1 Tax=Polypedilum vanderplanki TaxID=319348 RepID=A0A9J6BPC8_POLVA|nr:hypothetical protein PVAND_001473 [Polypedilum vanderplanki]